MLDLPQQGGIPVLKPGRFSNGGLQAMIPYIEDPYESALLKIRSAGAK